MEQILLYPGAGWDVSFPMYGTTILMDQQPETPFWEAGTRGKILADHFLAVLQHLMASTYPGCVFTDIPSENLWKWTHAIHKWTIYYFHSHRLGHDPLPELAKQATVMWIRKFCPEEKLAKSLRQLKCITGPQKCACFITDISLRTKLLSGDPPLPLSTLSDAALAQLRLHEETLIHHLSPPPNSAKSNSTAAAASTEAAAAVAVTSPVDGLRSSLAMNDGDANHLSYPDRKERDNLMSDYYTCHHHHSDDDDDDADGHGAGDSKSSVVTKSAARKPSIATAAAAAAAAVAPINPKSDVNTRSNKRKGADLAKPALTTKKKL